MTRADVAELQKLWLTEAQDDDIGLWSIARDIRERLGPDVDDSDVRRTTLEALRPLLGREQLRAVDLLPEGRFEVWIGSVDEQLRRIDDAWRALGHAPWIGDIVWFIAGESRLKTVP